MPSEFWKVIHQLDVAHQARTSSGLDDEASKPLSPEARKRVLRGTATAGAATFLIMSGLKLSRGALLRNPESWQSHLVLFTGISALVALIGFFVLRKEALGLQKLAHNETRYRLLFGKSLAGAYRAARDGKILDCNAAFCRLLGYRNRYELIGRQFASLYENEADRTFFLRRLEETGTLINFEEHLLRRDGREVWVLHNATLVHEGTNKQQVIRGTMTDVTETRKAEQEQRRLSAIVRCSDDAIISTNLAGLIESWNAGAERIFGYRADEIVGKPVKLLAPPDRVTELWAVLGEVWSGKEHEIETVRVRKDGTSFPAAISASPITEPSGKVIGGAAILRDITNQKKVEEAVQKSEVQYRLLFDSNPVPMWVFDLKTLRFLAVNEAAIDQYGFSKEEFLEMTVLDIRPEGSAFELLDYLSRRGQLKLAQAKCWRHRRRSGEILDVEVVAHDITFQNREAMLVGAFDVTERTRAQNQAREAEERYRAIFENATVGIFQFSREGRPIRINRALAEMHGFSSPEEMLAEIMDAADYFFVDRMQARELRRIAEEGGSHTAEVEMYSKDRSKFWARINFRAVRDAEGVITHHEGTVEDITTRKSAEAQIEYLAYYDALTDLPNRNLLKDRIGEAIVFARQRGKKLGVLIVDLDRLSAINDSLGRDAGDMVLASIAQRLQNCVQKDYTVGRLDGDAFLILSHEISGAAEAEHIALQICAEVSQPLDLQGQSLDIACCVGISIFPDDGEGAEMLIRNADAALNCARTNGPNSIRLYTGEMSRSHGADVKIAAD